MTQLGNMRRAQSTTTDTGAAIAEVLTGLDPADLALVVLFVGDGHDLPRIEQHWPYCRTLFR